jgi:hypothetical protein
MKHDCHFNLAILNIKLNKFDKAANNYEAILKNCLYEYNFDDIYLYLLMCYVIVDIDKCTHRYQEICDLDLNFDNSQNKITFDKILDGIKNKDTVSLKNIFNNSSDLIFKTIINKLININLT